MGLRINTNLASLGAQRSIDMNTRASEHAMKQLSSGNKYVNDGEGAADYSIGESLRAQQKGMQAAANNAATATNFVQVAEGGLSEQNNILIRMRELSVQSASDTYGDDERKMMNYEFQQLSSELDRIAQATTYGKNKLLSGDSKSLQFQVGPNNTKNDTIKFNYNTNTTASNLNVDSLDITDISGAQDSIAKVDDALTEMGKQRANLGALQSRLSSTINYTTDQAMSLEDARSKIQDTDVAKSYSDMVKANALQQYQISVLADANRQPGNVLRLIG